MFKKAFVASVFACLSLLVVACGNDAKDACEHMNDICADQQGYQKSDCSKANEGYDKMSDADKEKADKLIDCVMDKKTCADAIACAVSGS